jgi:hypothetical protein
MIRLKIPKNKQTDNSQIEKYSSFGYEFFFVDD